MSGSKALVGALERLALAPDLDAVTEILRSTCRQVVGADGIAVVMRDEDRCVYLEEDAVGPLWKGQSFLMEACVSGWAMLNRRTVVIPDVAVDERVPQEFYRGRFVRSLAIAPVRPDDPIGALGAYWARPRKPSAREIGALETLARAAGLAIDKQRLLNELSRALTEAALARDELRQRLRNAMAALGALATSELPAEHAHQLNARIAAIARAQELQQTSAGNVNIGALAEAELGAYEPGSSGRVALSGHPILVPPRQAAAVGIILNELAAESLQRGALSTPEGRLQLEWEVDGDHIVLEWRETTGGGSVAPDPSGQVGGFIDRVVQSELGGRINRTVAPNGFTCSLEFPAQ
ncbi:GAF domain-containing protein [Alsobacter soli]|nr:GAF domain-containing protein [Alsobacter soli]